MKTSELKEEYKGEMLFFHMTKKEMQEFMDRPGRGGYIDRVNFITKELFEKIIKFFRNIFKIQKTH